MPLRVLLLCIATADDGLYSAMADVVAGHAERMPEGWACKFVYGADAGVPANPGNVVTDVPDSLVPGVLRKTLRALEANIAGGYDYVIRTNLSTIWMWDRLTAYLEAAPRTGFAAGNADPHCGDHMCGCAIVWSADVARGIVAARDELWTSEEPDDVALSRVTRRLATTIDDVPRLDVSSVVIPSQTLHPGRRSWWVADADLTHVRFKGNDRVQDVHAMHAFAQLATRHPRAHPMILSHVAQCVGIARSRSR